MGMERLVESIKDRYNFIKYPTTYEEISNNQVKFSGGEYKGAGIDELSIYNDGAIVNTKGGTDISSAMLEDAVNWVQAEFNYEVLEYPPLTKLYTSEVEVQLGIDLDTWLEPIRSFGQVITNAAAKHYEKLSDYALSGLLMDFDTSELKGNIAGPFRLERKFGTPHNSSVYISSASLPTAEHLQVLEELEALAKPK